MKLEDSLSLEKTQARFQDIIPEIVETAQIWYSTLQQGMVNQARIYRYRFIYESGMYLI
jgi:hypothetical protein